MNKEQFLTILEASLLNFDGVSKEEIMKRNPDYDIGLVIAGINLREFLEEKIK